MSKGNKYGIMDNDGNLMPDNFAESNVDGKYYLVTDKNNDEYIIEGQTWMAYGKRTNKMPEDLYKQLLDKQNGGPISECQVVSCLIKHGEEINSPDAKQLIIFGGFNMDEKAILEQYIEEYNIKDVKQLDLYPKLSLDDRIKLASTIAKQQNKDIINDPTKDKNIDER